MIVISLEMSDEPYIFMSYGYKHQSGIIVLSFELIYV